MQQMLKLNRKYTHIPNKIKHQSLDDAQNLKLTWTVSTTAVFNISSLTVTPEMTYAKHYTTKSMPIEVNLSEHNEVVNVQ